MRGLVVVVVGLALLAGPAAGQGKVVEIIPGSGDERIPIADTELARYATATLPRARDILDRELIDYPSARFRSVVASGGPYGLNVTYCGLINSRNRAGGFTGWEPFMLMIAEDHEALRIGSDGIDGELVRTICPGRGRPINMESLSDRLAYR